MKTKLTLSVEETVVRRSKEHAARRGTSLSQFVEDLLERELAEGEEDFVEKWGGKLVLRERPDDPRMEYLLRKYG
jgi:hypothetical protein